VSTITFFCHRVLAYFPAQKHCIYYCWALSCPKMGLIFDDSLYGDFLLWCDFLSYKVFSVGCYLSYRTQDILFPIFITVIFTSVTSHNTFFTFILDLPLLFTDMMVKLLHVRRNKLVASSFHCVRFINQPYTAIASDIILVYWQSQDLCKSWCWSWWPCLGSGG
jgi:hypothetical protein